MNKSVKLPPPNTKAPAVYRELRRNIRLFVSTKPVLYSQYAKISKLDFRLTADTDIIVDSYPRSANSFFEAAFTRAHKGRLRVAHHSHAAGQVLAGLNRKLPCIILVREPAAAIASFYEMNGGHYSIALCTREYVAFYEALQGELDNLIIISTPSLENRFYDLMTLLKSRFKDKVDPYEIDEKTRDQLFAEVDKTGSERNGFVVERYSQSLSPEQMESRKVQLNEIRKLIQSGANAELFARAIEVFAKFESRAF